VKPQDKWNRYAHLNNFIKDSILDQPATFVSFHLVILKLIYDTREKPQRMIHFPAHQGVFCSGSCGIPLEAPRRSKRNHLFTGGSPQHFLGTRLKDANINAPSLIPRDHPRALHQISQRRVAADRAVVVQTPAVHFVDIVASQLVPLPYGTREAISCRRHCDSSGYSLRPERRMDFSFRLGWRERKAESLARMWWAIRIGEVVR